MTRHDSTKDGEWNGFTGRPSEELFKKCGFSDPSSEGVFISKIGPPGFDDTCCDVLAKMGYKKGD